MPWLAWLGLFANCITKNFALGKAHCLSSLQVIGILELAINYAFGC